MAASPMAYVPYSNCLFTIHLYGRFGAHQSAQRAPITFIFLIRAGCIIALWIYIFGNINCAFWTIFDAEFAAFAEFAVNCDIPFHFSTISIFLNSNSQNQFNRQPNFVILSLFSKIGLIAPVIIWQVKKTEFYPLQKNIGMEAIFIYIGHPI